MNEGRRGRRQRKALDKAAREELRQQRAIENEKKERQQAIDRIVPRMRRWCKLSEDGVVFTQDRRVATDLDRKLYLSTEGVVTISFDGSRAFTRGWNGIPISRLKLIAQIRKFEIHKPKNEMLILAEAFAGLHDDL